MGKTVFNSNDVVALGKPLSNTSNDIYTSLNNVDKLLDLLPTTLYDINSKKICEVIKEEQIIKLKQYASRLFNMNTFLLKMSQAYDHFDNDIK